MKNPILDIATSFLIGEKRARFWSAIVLGFLLILGLFSFVMNSPLNSDENMYVAAGVLAKNNIIYRDFAYLQTPYLPLLYGLLYKLTSTTYYLFIGRLSSFLFGAISILLIYYLSHKITKNLTVSISLSLLFMLNRVILDTMNIAGNHIVPIVFSLAGFYLFICSVSESRIVPAGVFFAGMSLALATGMKLYYVVTFAPYFIIAILYPRSLEYNRRFLKVFLPLLSGVIVGLLPLLYYLINYPAVFVFNNIGFHMIYTVWFEIAGYTENMSMITKLDYTAKTLGSSTNVVLFLGILFLFFAMLSAKRHKNYAWIFFSRMENMLAALLVLVTMPTVFIPTPLRAHYFALPIPFIIILMCCWYNSTVIKNRYFVKILFICLTLISFLFGAPRLFEYSYRLWNMNTWTGISVHNTAQKILANMGVVNNNKKIATLLPLYVLEAGLPIYNELATGAFLYTVGDLLPEAKRNIYSGTSPQTIRFLFKKDPPFAIFISPGFQISKIQSPLVRYTEENNFRKIENKFDGGTLYIRNDFPPEKVDTTKN